MSELFKVAKENNKSFDKKVKEAEDLYQKHLELIQERGRKYFKSLIQSEKIKEEVLRVSKEGKTEIVLFEVDPWNGYGPNYDPNKINDLLGFLEKERERKNRFDSFYKGMKLEAKKFDCDFDLRSNYVDVDSRHSNMNLEKPKLIKENEGYQETHFAIISWRGK